MKKIKFLLPVMLTTAITPVVAMTSCNKPGHEEKDYEGPLELSVNKETQTARVIGIDKQQGIENVAIPKHVIVKGVKYRVTEIGDNAFNNATKIKTITMANTITEIGSYAFQSCASLKSINLSQSLLSIKNGTFNSCSNLQSINIPKSVTSISTAFKGCSNLTTINVDPENTIYTSKMAGNETNCIIKKGSETELVYAGAAVDTIPTGIVKIAPYAFYDHNNISRVIIPDTVLTIDNYAFMNCSSIETINFGAQITSIGISAFENCHALTALMCPAKLRSIYSRAFYDCEKLAIVNFDAELNSIDQDAFYGTAIKKITIPAKLTDLGKYGAPFTNCSKLTTIQVDTGNTAFTSQDSGGNECNCIMNKARTKLYQGCNSGNEITILDSITTIGDSAFEGTSIPKVNLPEGLLTIGSMAFQGCYNLAKVTFPESLTTIDNGAFMDCESLTAINIPKNVEKIGLEAFAGCYKLETMAVDTANTKFASQIDTSEHNCIIQKSGLTIISGCNKTRFNNPIKVIGDYAFYKQFTDSVRAIKLPDSIEKIGTLAFGQCYRLEKIEFAGTVAQWKQIERGPSWHLAVVASEVKCLDGSCPLDAK